MKVDKSLFEKLKRMRKLEEDVDRLSNEIMKQFRELGAKRPTYCESVFTPFYTSGEEYLFYHKFIDFYLGIKKDSTIVVEKYDPEKGERVRKDAEKYLERGGAGENR